MTEKRNLTDQQKKFLDSLFDTAVDEGEAPDADKMIKAAMKEAGFSNASYPRVVEALKHEIIERAEYMLAVHSPAAVVTLGKVLSGDTAPGVLSRMDAAKTILDRVGLGKKDKLDLKVESNKGVFILPAKVETEE